LIKSFRYKGLEKFFTTGSKAGIQPKHAALLEEQLAALDSATNSADIGAAPGWKLHSLRGKLEGHFAIRVSGNWRLTFTFEGTDVVLLDYLDYH